QKGEAAIAIEGIASFSAMQGLEKMIKRMEGVEKVSIDFDLGKAVIKYDHKKIHISAIKERIIKADYKVSDIFRNDFLYTRNMLRQHCGKSFLRDFFIAAAISIPLLYISIISFFRHIEFPLSDMFSPAYFPVRLAAFQTVLAVGVISAGHLIFSRFFLSVKNGCLDGESLSVLSVCSLAAYSLYNAAMAVSGYPSYTESLHFASLGIITSALIFAKYCESEIKEKILGAIEKFVSIIPKKAVIIENSVEDEIILDETEIGDIIMVKDGEIVPVDGVVVEGTSAVDESALTGDKKEVLKQAGDEVFGGSLNISEPIHLCAKRVGNDASVFHIVKTLEDFQEPSSLMFKISDFAARFAVPAGLSAACIAGAFWYFHIGSFETALLAFASILLTLSSSIFVYGSPAALLSAAGKSAQNNILIKNPSAFKMLTSANAAVFEKSGVLVKGNREISDIVVIEKMPQNRFLQILASAENLSNSDIAEIIKKKAADLNLKMIPSLTPFKEIESLGIEVSVSDIEVTAGNEKLMNERKIQIEEYDDIVAKMQSEGKTTVYAAFNGKIAGIIAISNPIEQEDIEAIDALNKAGIETAMVTGDSKRTAIALGKRLHIKRINSQSSLKDRIAVVKRLQNEGKNVIMVGIGAEDAHLLRQSDAAIAFNAGSNTAIDCADIIIMRSNTMDIVRSINLCKKTISNIKFGITAAFIYTFISIALVCLLLSIIPFLAPVFAACFAFLIRYFILANALRLSR
ncbi:MAG: cation-translocating P-type ATPase, partial [Elusimicrobiota bacterium]|nr:cation-translocating P-type ATPase [Elusimicrobiota bacterium]